MATDNLNLRQFLKMSFNLLTRFGDTPLLLKKFKAYTFFTTVQKNPPGRRGVV